ncbi:ABC transporter ATP-binding protein [Acerihabitans arboris]|uniref:ABC-type dipeptide transporter n=1 Tax=Acerihabitans arboris TaxID=2691583 RepID=A0A845SRF6_9GAMM|nr:ABC transporter ATP-binding protein [Acerihabitans arboris]NDL65456.1 ATP-binding cassette domain-containing protein [Acerihabitans arboris]
MSAPLLRVNHLAVANRQGTALVDDVSFTLAAGEMLGLVGESGSGKTVTCRALMRLLPGEGLTLAGGEAWLGGTDIMTLDQRQMTRVRGRQLGMIFQNPASHLNPVMTIGGQIAESRSAHFGAGRREARAAAVALLRQVGIPDPERRVGHYPHEFSGGMRQRAMIAVALACEPKVLIADEPTTALDVTVQVQILRLLMSLRDRLGLAIIMITHDLGVVAQTCDRIAVMYGGRLCEIGDKRQMLARPLHPYTQGLIDCQPVSEGGNGRLKTIPGQPPSADGFPPGCRFHPRCMRAGEACPSRQPPMLPARDDAAHGAACFYPLQSLSHREGQW